MQQLKNKQKKHNKHTIKKVCLYSFL